MGFEYLIEDEEDEDGSQEELPNVAEISSGKVLAAYKRDQEKDDE